MNNYHSPITEKDKRYLILKIIALLKKEYKIKETKKYISNKLYELEINPIYKLNHSLVIEELELYEKLNNIVNVKISKEFINKILKLDREYINNKTIYLILSCYLAINTLKIEEIYKQEKKMINDNFSLENVSNDFENISLTDYQIKKIDERFNTNANVLSIFKKSIAYYYHIAFNHTIENAEEIARAISYSLFNDKKKANFTREYYRGKEYQVPFYTGKYISFI